MTDEPVRRLSPLTPLPPQKLMFMDKTSEAMLRNGASLLKLLRERVPFDLNGNVLDVGCGYGRMAYTLLNEGFTGTYVGLEILPNHVAWLRENLSPWFRQSSTFLHLDVLNERYNPNGKMSADQVIWPPIGMLPDYVFILSVFTHMYASGIENYLAQLAKVTGKDTVAYATFFLLNESQAEMERQGVSRYPMTVAVEPYSRCYDAKDQLWAIGFDQDWVVKKIGEAGFEIIEPIELGSWCGRKGSRAYQDSIFFRRSGKETGRGDYSGVAEGRNGGN
jgi:SAM-dependent methyltransferase